MKRNGVFPNSNRLVMVKKIYYGPKYGTPFCFMSRLVKIVKFLKTLLKIRMVLHVIVGCAISFVLKFLRTCAAPVSTLNTFNFNEHTDANYLFSMKL